MATIRKRGNSYQIRVSCGYDVHGKQVEQSMTWKLTAGMTARQIEKELNRHAVMFEEACMNGQIVRLSSLKISLGSGSKTTLRKS